MKKSCSKSQNAVDIKNVLCYPLRADLFMGLYLAKAKTGIRNKNNMKTFSAKPQEIERKWYVIDAAGKVLGQVAVEAANLLRGKNKTIFTPHVDCGDYVIIVNADKVVLTGNKERAKIYTRYTGYVGNQVVTTPAKLRKTHPELIVEMAVKGMVPHTRQGRAQGGRLKVYVGAEHPHTAQTPEAVTIA